MLSSSAFELFNVFFRYVSTCIHFLPFGCLVKPCKRKIDWWKYIIKQYEYAQQQQQSAREKNMSLHFATIFGPMQSTGLQSTFEFVCVFAFGVHSKSVRKRANVCITICLLNSCIVWKKNSCNGKNMHLWTHIRPYEMKRKKNALRLIVNRIKWHEP